MCIFRKVKKSESKSQQIETYFDLRSELCIFRKVKKSESKSQLDSVYNAQLYRCVYFVKLKNLKANHNGIVSFVASRALCIFRKVKKSESKSQPEGKSICRFQCCVYFVKLKNLKANHNSSETRALASRVVYIS